MKNIIAQLTQKQKKQVIVTALSVLVVLVVMGVLFLYGQSENTIQNRLAQTPNVTVSLLEKSPEEAVPDSWQTPEVTEDKKTDAEKPLAKTSEEKPQVDVKEKPNDTKPEPASVEEPEAPEAKQQTEQKPEQQSSEQLPQPAVTPAVITNEIPMVKFARPFDQQDPRPRIALIIEDMGLAASITQSAIQDLPGAVTLAFTPFAPNIESDMLKARAAGHEMLLSIPMQPDNYPRNDSGPNSLLVSLSDEENIIRLNRALSRSEGYVGIIPWMGQKFVTQESKLTPIIESLLQEGLMIIDGTATNASMIAPLSRLKRLPFARAETRIDAASRMALDAQLADLEQLAQQRGQVVAVIRPYPVTIERLNAWIQTLDQKGLILAPVTAVSSMAVVPATSNIMPAVKPLPEAPIEQQVDAAMDTPPASGQ